ncbi:MAG: carboxypeptidase regulatory-like domain-containing protein [Intrasporangium sp.]|uniref:carboxypeptidase regulatory-like domain-containing protein n=1 Tax=Intrasporangium sp. TaxID=1925024 RepID=UPI002648199E|nr:carboxypeptidase regulatory-like domain-containing protein [Intrasporangium sp.]MDN5795261.1 carboxypeptidase regulatory-like domain-containing protein [Intrasporangium sp.]
MAEHELHPDDAAILDRLHAIVEIVDPVPPDVVEMGKAAFMLHHVDAELMTMLDVPVPQGVLRAGLASSRVHFFEHDDVSIDVEVTRRGDFAQAVGVVTDTGDPGLLPDGHIVLETASSSVTVDLDRGRFVVDRVPLGLVRLVLEKGGERVLSTGWFEAG